MRLLISDLCTCTLPRAGRVSLTNSSGWRSLGVLFSCCGVFRSEEEEERREKDHELYFYRYARCVRADMIFFFFLSLSVWRGLIF